MFGLSSLVAPVSESDFLSRYWGKRAVVIQGSDNKFSEVFGWSEVNHFLNNTRPSYEGLRLLHDKKELPREMLADARKWLADGATLVINSVNQIDPVVGRFSSYLARDLNCSVNTNCYASYTSKQGFDTHYDQHDVFIVQVEGNKHWAVFEPTVTFPLHVQTKVRDNPPSDSAYLERELTPGDVLYIPRGHWHYAVAASPSVHLTVGPTSRSGVEFLHWLGSQLMENDEFFRQDFPIAGTSLFGGAFSSDFLEKHIEKFRSRLIEELESEAINRSSDSIRDDLKPLNEGMEPS